MNRLLAAGIVLVSAIALALGPALLITGPAHASTAPITNIGNGAGKCLTDPGFDHAPGIRIVMRACQSRPNARDQAWVLADGHIRLHGTPMWATVGEGNYIFLTYTPGPADWVYGPTHTIHIGNGWLTWFGSGKGYPHYSATFQPAYQVWYAFTKLPGPAKAEPIPTCYSGLLSIGSKNYKMKFCNTSSDNWLKLPGPGKEWDLTVDGGLANGSAIFAFKINKP